MLQWPQKFDLNEWFIILALVAGYGLMYFMPRRFPNTITFLLLMFSLIISKMTDHFIATPPFDLYDFNDAPKFELADFATWFVYPPFGYFFVYGYERWNIRGISVLIYIVCWALFSIAIEWISLHAHLFTYKGWKLMYSFPTYLIVLSIYIVFFRFIKNYFYTTTRPIGR